MQASLEERLLAALGAALIVALMGYLLLAGLPVHLGIRADPAITLIDIAPPPAPKPPPKPRVEPVRHSHASGKPSARNLAAKATAVVVPPPRVPLALPSPVIAAVTPGAGFAAAAGASDRAGPGTGAGGEGDGTGDGHEGDGDGGGDIPPRLVKGRLKPSDLPADLAEAGVAGTVSVRYDVDAAGRVGNCEITGSSGSGELDALTCRLVEQRFRYEPSRDPTGRRVASSIEEDHRWTIERSVEPPPRP